MLVQTHGAFEQKGDVVLLVEIDGVLDRGDRDVVLVGIIRVVDGIVELKRVLLPALVPEERAEETVACVEADVDVAFV